MPSCSCRATRSRSDWSSGSSTSRAGGAFYRTSLEEHLRALSVETILVCGCNFPNCPRTTIYEASERDFRIVLVPDATSGVYARGLDELRGIGVDVSDADHPFPVRRDTTP